MTTAADSTEAVAQPSRNEALADRTLAVADEIDWFATRYPTAIRRFRETMRRGASRAEALLDRETVTVAEAGALQETFDGIVATVRELLAPHFLIHVGIRDRTETHTATVRRFARRNDQDRIAEELRQLATYARGYGSEVSTEENFPRVPILNRLNEFVRAGEFRPRRPLMFRVYHGPTNFRSYVYKLQEFGRYPFFDPSFRNRIVSRFDDVYGSLDAPDGRARRYYLSAFEGRGERPGAFGSRAPQPRSEQVIYLQRYPDAATARRAFERVLARDGVGVDQYRDEPYPLGDSRWDRVFYQFDGDTMYTIFTQAGPFLLATGAGRTAWEERVDWNRVLRRTFLAGE